MRSTIAAAADTAALTSSASFYVGTEVNLSVKKFPVVNFAGKRLTVSCAATSSPQFGRRALVYMATTSFLIPFPSSVSAIDEASLLHEQINKILEKVKSQVDSVQPVSWADLIATAGAEAVSICGGPMIPIRLGRIDATVPDTEGRLPEESLAANTMKQCFQKKGFSTQELVALSGALSLGSKGFGSPFVFDNSYYKILLEKPWSSSGSMSSMIGLPSDRALSADDECISLVCCLDFEVRGGSKSVLRRFQQSLHQTREYGCKVEICVSCEK